MQNVKGTIGYQNVVEAYVKVTNVIPFVTLHKDFLKFLPTSKSLVLDIGAGTGRDAYELSLLGHTVFAIEPLKEFIQAGKANYNSNSNNLYWIDDSLPNLINLAEYDNKVDFILSSSVWHHLNESEQKAAMIRVSNLLKSGGIFALSLRNGPAGAGTHIFPVSVDRTISIAKECYLTPVLELRNQPSLLKNKENVTWARLMLKKA